jgi:NhaP-type Na+/H+ or K+/H+ antiporter
MAATRIFSVASPLILAAIGIAMGACAVLFASPHNLPVWQIGSWTPVIALFFLLVLVLASAYSLATNHAARTWQRIGSFLLGLACLAVVAVGSF